MTSQIWQNKNGTRQVESIVLDGRTTLKVTDPRYSMQSKLVLAFIPVSVHEGRLSAATQAALRERGVELADLGEVRS